MDSSIQKWGEKINWKKRVKAACKPCWEIRYCPYGPLVEDFPLAKRTNEKSCRIFGHDCPVFYVAEPFTETKDLRNISRSIPRRTQFRVLKRENQICADCSSAVGDDDIEFDHIIPWSKGGSSDEHNVKLLCRKCNRKKGNKFEKEFLIGSINEHLADPVPFEFIETIFLVVTFAHDQIDFINNEMTSKDHCEMFERKKVGKSDEAGSEILNEIRKFFISQKPEELKPKEFNALKYRWGFVDGKFHLLSDVSKKYRVNIDGIFELDHDFIERLGFYANITTTVKEKWTKS